MAASYVAEYSTSLPCIPRTAGWWVSASPGGHCVPGERRPLVACDTHTAEEIEVAYKKWRAKESEEEDSEIG